MHRYHPLLPEIKKERNGKTKNQSKKADLRDRAAPTPTRWLDWSPLSSGEEEENVVLKRYAHTHQQRQKQLCIRGSLRHQRQSSLIKRESGERALHHRNQESAEEKETEPANKRVSKQVCILLVAHCTNQRAREGGQRASEGANQVCILLIAHYVAHEEKRETKKEEVIEQANHITIVTAPLREIRKRSSSKQTVIATDGNHHRQGREEEKGKGASEQANQSLARSKLTASPSIRTIINSFRSSTKKRVS